MFALISFKAKRNPANAYLIYVLPKSVCLSVFYSAASLTCFKA